MSTSSHTPVLAAEVVEALAPRDNGIYVDATFGRGGYSRALLTAARTQVYGIDRDPDAVSAGEKMAAEFPSRFKLLQGPFGAMEVLLAGAQVRAVDGIALDLGMSSPQIDDPARGFSFQSDGPLDMRMSQSGPTAADIVNKLDERELADIIFNYGEERHSRRVAKRIVEARGDGPITRTGQLADIVRRAVPRSGDGIDPATRTFQALRIYVNDELDELRRGLAAAENLLKPEGRLAVVSFHSLEDRTVKEFLRRRSSTAYRRFAAYARQRSRAAGAILPSAHAQAANAIRRRNPPQPPRAVRQIARGRTHRRPSRKGERRMIRASQILFWFGLSIAASLALYHTSDRVQELDRQLHDINVSIEAEQQSIHVLKAEWVYLANPARVEAETKKHLALRPTAPKQVIGSPISAMPLPTRKKRWPRLPINGTADRQRQNRRCRAARSSACAAAARKACRHCRRNCDAGHINDRMILQHASAPVSDSRTIPSARSSARTWHPSMKGWRRDPSAKIHPSSRACRGCSRLSPNRAVWRRRTNRRSMSRARA